MIRTNMFDKAALRMSQDIDRMRRIEAPPVPEAPPGAMMTRPDLPAFLRGAAVTYDGMHNGKPVRLEAEYSRPADLPVARLRIRKVGHRRALMAVMMNEAEASTFFINLIRNSTNDSTRTCC